MKKLIFIASLSFLVLGMLTVPTGVFSQNNKVQLSGTITDSSSKPISFVTVRFYKQNDLLNILKTTITNDKGKFIFSKIDSGSYTITFTHTGFEGNKRQVNIKPSAGNIDMGNIPLSMATGTLREVTVKSQRPLVEQADDKIIYNVEDDPASKSETAIDILRKTPFVSVDGEDNVQVNGKTNFKVLLNGRETSMFARNLKDALRGFPGALISKIEVITNPSAKYDGEGIGGLINIITKKKVVGYNGTLSSFSRTIDKLNALSANANAKVGKLGASLFFNVGNSQPVTQYNSTNTIPVNPIAYSQRTLDGLRTNSGKRAFGNAELSWEADSLTTISTYANINSSSNKTLVAQTITTDYNNAASTTSLYNLKNENNNPGISIGTDFIKKFKKNKEKEFGIRLFGEFGKGTSFLNSIQDNPGIDRYIINNSKSLNNQYTIQSDYTLPLSKTGKLESGVKAILRRASSDFESLIKSDPSAAYKINPSNTDNFKYLQDVYSIYSTYSFKIKQSSFRVGTRVEHTNVNGDFIFSNTKVKHSYTTFLPNIQLSKKLSKVLTMVVSYNKRLQRPYILDLNPFVNNNDSLDISYGNPNLGPQIIHNISAQGRFVKGSTFGAINLQGSYSDNKILDYAFFNTQTGITKTTSLNIGKEFQSSLNVNLNMKLSVKWTLFFNAGLRYSKVTNNAQSSQSNQGFGYSLNSNSSYKLSDKFNISCFLGLWKDPVTIQTTYPFSTWYNVALNHKFFKEKLNVSLRAVNFLESFWNNLTVVNDLNFTSINTNRQIRRGIALALTWRFGKLTENVSKKKGVTNDDLLTKPQPTTTN